ncbi:MAG: DUF6265 family protein [Bacteroidota bacterium]
MKITLITFSIAIIVIACNTRKQQSATSEPDIPTYQSELKKLDWILGAWSNKAAESSSFERWQMLNDSTYTAFGYTQVGNDTVFAERLTIYEDHQGLHLKVKGVVSQDTSTVVFTKIPSAEGILTFENKLHDFPQQITYSNPVRDSIHAWISGTVQGEYRKVDFYFVRDQ